MRVIIDLLLYEIFRNDFSLLHIARPIFNPESMIYDVQEDKNSLHEV